MLLLYSILQMIKLSHRKGRTLAQHQTTSKRLTLKPKYSGSRVWGFNQFVAPDFFFFSVFNTIFSLYGFKVLYLNELLWLLTDMLQLSQNLVECSHRNNQKKSPALENLLNTRHWTNVSGNKIYRKTNIPILFALLHLINITDSFVVIFLDDCAGTRILGRKVASIKFNFEVCPCYY